jgi:DNA-binding transcriptional LysR family regulator
MLHGRLLTYLHEVARLGSMRKAAERLNVAASAINRQILALEEELGTPIFQRMPRKLVLTAAGEVIIRHVRQTLKDLEQARSKIEDLKGLRRGEITVAMMSGLAANIVPRIVAVFQRSNPRVKVLLKLLATGDEIVNAVALGEADLGLGFDFPKSGNLRVFASVPARLGAVMAPTHPLAGRAGLRLSECAIYPLIIADKTTAIRPLLNAVFQKSAFTPEAAIETNSIEIMRHSAMLNDSITFLTPFDIEVERQTDRLSYVPIREFMHSVQNLMLVGRDRGSSTISSVFVELLKAGLKESR